MAESSRVEELRKRYHENPRRFFAPLANEYRKAGFIDRAILLCQKHLGEQPENMNGQIVYGQALFESGRHEEARGPFGAALELDPENLIALRHLGDIGRLSGNNEEAQKWYGRVLEYDRRNDEVRELFEQVGGTMEPRSGVSVPAPQASREKTPPRLAREQTPPQPARAQTPAGVDASAKTVEITPRPLASVKTAEVEARPQRRASLLDISFDFGETAAELPAAAPSAAPARPSQPQLRSSGDAEVQGEGAEALQPPSRGDAEARSEGGEGLVPLDLSLLDDSDPTIQPVARQQPSTALPSLGDEEEAASASSAAPREKPPTPASQLSAMSGAFPLDAEFPLDGDLDGDYTDLGESLLEPEPDGAPSPAPQQIEGLQVADFSADVAPLADLEPSEFTPAATNIAPLPELETAEFMVPGDEAPMGSIIDFELEPAVGQAPESPSASREPVSAAPEPPSATPEASSAGASSVDLPFLDMPDVEPAAAEPTFDPTSTVPTPSTAPAIVTETMAELYLEQGFHAEAIEVYRTLIAQDPLDERLKAKLASLEGARASLEFATPTEGLDDIGERAPTNAMLAEVSFDDVSSLGTPKTPSAGTGRAPTPRDRKSVEPAVAGAEGEGTGPTAREFLAAFVHRKVNTAAAWAVPATESPLDALFGNAVPDVDQRAANRLAGIGTTSAPSGGSMLDTLFAVDTGEIVEAPSVGAPRASQKLRFDQFFSSTSTPPEPRTAEPGPVDESTQEQPAQKSPSSDDQSPDSDDLDRFHGWLKGLTE